VRGDLQEAHLVEHLLGFLLAGLALVASPGPATLSLAALGAAFGGRGAAAYMAGLVSGMVAVMAITASGVAALVLALPGVMPVVLALASAYFVYLAVRIATAPPLAEAGDDRRPPSFFGGVLLNLANPKAYAAMAALFAGFVLVDQQPALDAALKAAILIVVILIVNTAWLYAGAALTRFMREPKTNRAINVTFAVLLLVSLGLALLV
jgi:threonine/homoserine/homoserine lactone efflux protein